MIPGRVGVAPPGVFREVLVVVVLVGVLGGAHEQHVLAEVGEAGDVPGVAHAAYTLEYGQK